VAGKLYCQFDHGTAREYHGGDYLHPNDAGLRAMANAIPLERL